MKRAIKDIPDGELDFVIASLKVDFTIITKVKQDSGLWTVIGESSDSSINPKKATTTSDLSDDHTFTDKIDVLARTIWGEARSESREGKEAVASVILNRLKKPERFGNTIEEVCLKPFQFSCWNLNDSNLHKLKTVNTNDSNFVECLSIAQAAVNGNLDDSTIGADHYHTTTASPDWAKNKTACKTIGNHLFYNNIS